MKSRLLALLLVACGGGEKGSESDDADGDGFPAGEDCDDADPAVNPDAEEVCDGINNDCDSYVDENVLGKYWPDADEDGHGVDTTPVTGCEAPPGYAETNDDCDDTDGSVYPGAAEDCNGKDDNCDGVADDGVTTMWYPDADGDGYGDASAPFDGCVPPSGEYVADGTDCDDADPLVNPGAEEVCDGDDDNCDGRADQGEVGTWYSDVDGDGYGSPGESVETCDPPEGWVKDNTDCRPGEADAYPGAPEQCNDRDDDCDGDTDEGFDDDGDGHESDDCPDGDDCDDTDPEVYGGSPEVFGDGIDNDCDGSIDEAYDGTYALGSADAKLTASRANYDAGRLVDAGDLTGDGIGDLVVATLYADSYGGGGYIVPGPAVSGDMSKVGYRIQGNATATYGAGRSIGTGDATGDGIEEVVFGAPYGGTSSAFILVGPVTSAEKLTDAEVKLVGRSGTYCGHGSDLGDINDDGIADAVIGAYYTNDGGPASGTVYVVYGPLTTASVSLLSDADATLAGANPNAYTGRVIRAGVDLDGDGVGDFLAPAPYDSTGGSYSGTVYVVYGPVSGASSLSSADGILVGESPNDYAGSAVALGDVNGDGLGDAVVGAYNNSGGGSAAGAAYVVFGPSSGTVDLGSSDVIVRGVAYGEYAGSGVAAGDTSGDGYDELLVGAIGGSTGGAYLFKGPITGTLSVSAADATFTGERRTDYAGQGVSLGDLDGDGWADVAVGAPSESTGGAAAGAAYVQYPD